MKSRTRTLLIFAVLLPVMMFAGYRIYQAYEKAQTAQKSPKKKGGGGTVVTVNVGEAEMSSVREAILITGSLKPKEQVAVMPKATGRLEEIRFQVGDLVRKGDLIAEMDSDELAQQIKRAAAALGVVQATIAQRSAEMSNAQAELDRAETLLNGGLISRQDYEASKTNLAVVKAQVELAKAQEDQANADINELQIQLSQRKIYAPMTSHVAERHVDVGALVSPTTPIITLVNLSTMVTRAYVPEREIGKLRPGTAAKVQVDAFGDRTFDAHISRVSPVLDAATRSALVEVEIPNPDGGLKAEMFARVHLDLGTMRPAVMIPREALVYRGQQPSVYELQGKKPILRPIETGITQGDRVEVLSNLNAGTRIVTRGATMIGEGDQIKIVGEGGSSNGPGTNAGDPKKPERPGRSEKVQTADRSAG